MNQSIIGVMSSITSSKVPRMGKPHYLNGEGLFAYPVYETLCLVNQEQK